MITYTREDNSIPALCGKVIGGLVIKPWLLMLISGALGERLGVPILQQLDFWSIWLGYNAVRLLVGHTAIDKWKSSNNLEEIK